MTCYTPVSLLGIADYTTQYLPDDVISDDRHRHKYQRLINREMYITLDFTCGLNSVALYRSGGSYNYYFAITID